MRKNHTDITVVLDRSGSMASVKDDTIGGFNTFLEDQRTGPGTATITVHQFDDKFETLERNRDITKARKLTPRSFVPRGNTALLDAIGKAIVLTGNHLSSLPEDRRAEKVVFVIVTDGYENASREYTRHRIFEMIDHQRSKYNWEFVFLGANQDAIKTAVNLGMNAGTAMSYANNSMGTQAMFHSASSNMRAYRSAGACGQSLNFSDADKEAQIKAGLKK